MLRSATGNVWHSAKNAVSGHVQERPDYYSGGSHAPAPTDETTGASTPGYSAPVAATTATPAAPAATLGEARALYTYVIIYRHRLTQLCGHRAG